MKISYDWLKTHIKNSLPAPETVAEKILFHAFEVESVEKKGADTIFDISVLPNRAGDALSHRGMAREVAGLFDVALTPFPYTLEGYPTSNSFVHIASPDCTRYILFRISGITMKETPAWIRERLEAVGQQSVNAVVDIANFVMLDGGQPVHIFDADAIDGGITVRTAKAGEKITLLGDVEKEIPEDALVIADLFGPLALAGIKGGKSAAVTPDTKNIVVEVAHFTASVIGKTARALGLLTEAAKRFENGVPVSLGSFASAQLISLLTETLGGSVEWYEDTNPNVQPPALLSFTAEEIASRVGKEIQAKDISDIFRRYGYTFSEKDGTFSVTIPDYRADITGVHDLVEEVGRVLGYDTIEPAPLSWKPLVAPHEGWEDMMKIKSFLASKGFLEVYTYTFGARGEVEVAYGFRGKTFLRAELSSGLKTAYELASRMAPLLMKDSVSLFEMGTVFLKDHEEVRIALVEKGVFQEMNLGAFLEAHPEAKEKDPFFSPFQGETAPFQLPSAYPFIVRDVAVWVSNDSEKKALEESVATFSHTHCPVPARVFDTFSKEGKTSIGYRLVFQSTEKTLTDAEVETLFSLLRTEIEETLGLHIR